MWQRWRNVRSPESTTGDKFSGTLVSQMDSFTDSGFLSGTNLTSTDLLPYEHHDDFSPPPSRDEGQTKVETQNLDSGIDISEQLSSLNIAADSCRSVVPSTDSRGEDKVVDNSPIQGLSQERISFLREILQRDEDGDNNLHIAVMRGFVEVAYQTTRLLPHQAFLDLPNNHGKTALHMAVMTGEKEIVRHLLVCGASPVARDIHGNTPLHLACSQGNLDLVIDLTRPITVDEVALSRLSYNPAHTPGTLAADLGNYEGQTCIHIAASRGHKEIIRHLAWFGADVNAKECKSGRTALHMAVEAKNLELIAVLKDVGASVDAETYSGLSAYQLAVINGEIPVAELLIKYGATSEDEWIVEDDQASSNGSVACGVSNDFTDWSDMADLRIGGISVSNFPTQVPVSTCSPFNADLYF